MSDYDALLLRVEHQDAEIERLRAKLQQHEDAVWVGLERAKDVRAAAIEECARVAEQNDSGALTWTEDGIKVIQSAVADAIRALKDTKP